MKKAELVDQMASGAGISKSSADAALKSLIDSIVQTIKKKDGKFRLNGLGTFTTARRKARKGRNPKTGESIKIKACKVIKFKASKKLKGAV